MASLKNTTINDTGYLRLPSGTTAQRPGSPVAGMMRYNSDLGKMEYYDGTNWSNDIVTSGLVLWLDAGNTASYPGTGTTWTDLSGNGNNGTLVNGVGYSSSDGGSLTFDGVNDYIDLGNYNPIIGTTDFTISFFIYNDRLINYQAYMGNHQGSSYVIGWSIGSTSSGTINFVADDVSGSPWAIVFGANTTIGINTWYNLTLTRSSNVFTWYINAVSAGSTTNSINIGQGAYNLTIGQSGDIRFFQGKIPNVQIYNRALSEAEIQQNFNALRSRYGI